MLIYIWTRDDETGLLDDEFKDGDVKAVKADTDPIGGLEPKSSLIVKVPDPPNYAKVEVDIQKTDYAAGATPQDAHVVRRKRAYRLDWRSYFTADEIAIIEDGNQALPDGELESGGSVTNGIVENKFVFTDLRRK